LKLAFIHSWQFMCIYLLSYSISSNKITPKLLQMFLNFIDKTDQACVVFSFIIDSEKEVELHI